MNRSTPGLPPSITNSWSSPKLMCIKLVMPSSHLILCHPLFLLPPIPPRIRGTHVLFLLLWFRHAEFSFPRSVGVHLLSCVWGFGTPGTAARQASLSFTIFRSLLKLMSVESVMSSNHLVLCCPLLFLPSVFPSIRVFSKELAFHSRWNKVLELQLQLKCFQGIFRVDFLEDLIFLFKGLLRVFSSTTVQGHRFFSTQPFLLSSSYICMWLLEKQ